LPNPNEQKIPFRNRLHAVDLIFIAGVDPGGRAGGQSMAISHLDSLLEDTRALHRVDMCSITILILFLSPCHLQGAWSAGVKKQVQASSKCLSNLTMHVVFPPPLLSLTFTFVNREIDCALGN
jgi:hypothetical protein